MNKIIREKDLKSATGLSVRTVRDLIRDNKFPRPIPLSKKAKGWLESEVVAWQRERTAVRDAGHKSPNPFKQGGAPEQGEAR